MEMALAAWCNHRLLLAASASRLLQSPTSTWPSWLRCCSTSTAQGPGLPASSTTCIIPSNNNNPTSRQPLSQPANARLHARLYGNERAPTPRSASRPRTPQTFQASHPVPTPPSHHHHHLTLRHHSPQPSPTHPHAGTRLSLDPKEAAKFAALAAEWWNPLGPFAPLHRFNPARCKFIRTAVCAARGIPPDQLRPLLGLRALDVGCGGGILAESLARLGAQVHAIDVTEENVAAAQQHSLLDPALSQQIRYECVAAEEVLARGDRYDLVVVSEVVEHVRRPDLFLQAAAQLMEGGAAGAGGGEQADGSPRAQGTTGAAGAADSSPSLLIVSTLNRTVESFAVAIVGAEYVSGAVPRGTHDWRRFITPQELTLMAEQAGLELRMMAGIGWSLAGPMQLTEHTGVNYISCFGHK